MEVTREQVKEFLTNLKPLIGSPFFNFLGERDKNQRLLTELGWTIPHFMECLANLTVEDFYKADINDSNKKVYVFGLKIDVIDCFVKLEIVFNHGRYYCTCHSFHQAERPMEFPFGGGE